MKTKLLVIPLMLLLSTISVSQVLNAHSSGGTQSWSSDYTNGGLTGSGSFFGGVRSGYQAFSTGGTGYAISQSAFGGSSSGGVNLFFEDNNPTGAGSYYHCNGSTCGIYVPNYGQSSSQISISGVYRAVGWLQSYFAGNSGYSNAWFAIYLEILQDGSSSVYSNLLSNSGTSCSNGSCTGQAYLHFDSDYSFSASASLAPGHFYNVRLQFVIGASSSAGTFTVQYTGMSCFNANSGGSPACTTTTNDPGDTVCPSGISSPCFYVQWKSASYTLQVPDFAVSANPSSVSINAGSSATSTITLSSINGLSTSIGLSASSNDPNLGFSFNPTNPSVTPSQAGTSVLTISDSNTCDGGSYSITVTGSVSDGTLTTTESTSIPITVSRTCDFSIGANPSSLSIHAGKSGTSTISLVSINGFSGSVSLTATSPSGITTSFSPNPVNVPSGGFPTSTATISVARGVAHGTYTVAVTGTGPYGSHSTNISVTV